MFFQFAPIPAYPSLDLARYLTDPFDIRSLGPLWTSSPDAEPIYGIGVIFIGWIKVCRPLPCNSLFIN
jgi:hypothetical protein